MEHILLTDDKLLNELAFDKSDVFYWLTQQAKRGVASAQVILLMNVPTTKRTSLHLASIRYINV